MPERAHARSRLPQGDYPARIESLAHDGRGVAHVDGKAVFIHGALPGEEVNFRYTARHSQYDEGRSEEIITASPDRVEPRCQHFDVCGGCSLQHLNHARQVACKQDWLLDNLRRIARLSPDQVVEPLISPAWGYRHKARLGVRHVIKKGRVLVGFRERSGSFVADLRRCEVLPPRVGGLLEELGDLASGLSVRDRLPQIEAAIGDEAAALSFRVLRLPTEADVARLIAFGQQHDIQIWLQAEGPETCRPLWPPQARLSYRLPEFDLEFEFFPYHFTQINPYVNRAMVAQAMAWLDLQNDDRALDLFCGLGNFTLAMARRAQTVVGVEGDRRLAAWAGHNAVNNGVDNARFLAADLTGEVLLEPFIGHSDKILLDPPRSGALAMIPRIAALKPRRVVYVSCHPATLARDAGELAHRFGYRLRRVGMMDMFPHTAHVEAMALFER